MGNPNLMSTVDERDFLELASSKGISDEIFSKLFVAPLHGLTSWTLGPPAFSMQGGYDIDYQFIDAGCPFIIIERYKDDLCLIILTSNGVSIANPFSLAFQTLGGEV